MNQAPDSDKPILPHWAIRRLFMAHLETEGEDPPHVPPWVMSLRLRGDRSHYSLEYIHERDHHIELGTIEEVDSCALRITSQRGSVIILRLMTWEDWKRHINHYYIDGKNVDYKIRNIAELHEYCGLGWDPRNEPKCAGREGTVEGDPTFKVVEDATVYIFDHRMQGVLIERKLIVAGVGTLGEPEFNNPDPLTVKIRSGVGLLKAQVLFLDSVNDIAILGRPDPKKYPDEAERYDAFCARTPLVRMNTDEHPPGTAFRIRLLTHRLTWIKGKATQKAPLSPSLNILADEIVRPPCYGGPIVNESGSLVGVVSWRERWTRQMKQGRNLISPRPHLSMPVWIRQQYFGTVPKGV